MTAFVFTNNVNTTLASAAAPTATTLTLASTNNLPTIPSGSVWSVTLNDTATRQIFEVVYVTAISGANLTVTRGQEGTAAQNWAVGAYVYADATAGVLRNFANINGSAAQAFSALTIYSGALSAPSGQPAFLQSSTYTASVNLAYNAYAQHYCANPTVGVAAVTLSYAQANFAGINGTSGSFFANSGSTTDEGDIGAGAAGQNRAYLYNNAAQWGLYSPSGGSIIYYNRSNGAIMVGGGVPITITGAGPYQSGDAVNLGQFPSSLGGSSGWKRYPDPSSPTGYYIEQWSTTNTAYFAANGGSGQQNLTAALPFAFPYYILQAGLMSTNPSFQNILVYSNVGSYTNSSVTVDINSYNGVAQNIYATVWAKGY